MEISLVLKRSVFSSRRPIRFGQGVFFEKLRSYGHVLLHCYSLGWAGIRTLGADVCFCRTSGQSDKHLIKYHDDEIDGNDFH